MANDFSRTWFAVFLDTIPPEQTAAEVRFLTRQLPREEFPRVLDVCCGSGRHANELAAAGYEVVGVDRDDDALHKARSRAPEGARYVNLDVRRLDELDATFDAATNLWASFGWFDEATDRAILSAIRRRLRPGGRLIVDVYNREHLVSWPAEEVIERDGRRIHTRRRWDGNRLHVSLDYGDGAGDEMEWRLYSPADFARFVEGAGFRVITTCSWWNETRPPSAADARMQMVLES